jgi:hypothetical protein
MSDKIIELFTNSTKRHDVDWTQAAENQFCSFLNKKCVKVRKSQPEISIGTCTVRHGVKNPKDVVICPHRFLERNQIFMDCIDLLTLHEKGNELHKIPEISIPGGNVDYVLASVRNNKVVDFVGIEIQTLDTTGSWWQYRQQFLSSVGVAVQDVNTKIVDSVDLIEGDEFEETAISVGAVDLVDDSGSKSTERKKGSGMNWKMTAKTILMQLHHKVTTFEHLNKHLVVAIQDSFLEYMKKEFSFEHIKTAKLGDSMHFHSYRLDEVQNQFRLRFDSAVSTDANGIAVCLGLNVSPSVELETIISTLQARISEKTLLTI